MVQQDASLLSVVILLAPMLLSWNRSNRMMVIGFNMLGVICITAYHYCYHPLVYLPFFMSGLTCWMFAVGAAVNNR
ncbi:hypothetical protein [Vibrio barjaei]|uniref:hypothetical protein n=1 Tax=Vibrio barjaei TaxID=1676683 RepID=UPI0022853277|nr:hypothetical protein [Vibrio barjaei]